MYTRNINDLWVEIFKDKSEMNELRLNNKTCYNNVYKNSYFSVNSSAQIISSSAKSTDLTILSCGKFGSLSYRTEIVLYNATKLYTCR